ncbi:hypothetical protein [Streptomyces sp. P17]|uniref:hypothetical protein n=1 Tax=Streptomyces sp. P17 TaxID=3074716 RepID=UPI0028F412AE|nr:hypothetical protein [Streptomyces sp. P17]MDT9696695.1 hypothetical protein [Streptomyces sp. P17]
MLDDLAAAAAGVLVSSMGSAEWEERARPTFVDIYALAMKQDVGPTLDSYRSELLNGRLSARDAARIWKSKIREAFKKGFIANEVHRFIEDFRPAPLACPSCAAQPEGGDIYCVDCGDVLGAPVPVAVTARLPGPLDQGVPQDHVDFRQSSFHAPVIAVQNNYGHTGPAADGWPRLAELRRRALGVRPVTSFGDEPALPPYIPRDRDPDLDRLVAQALREGGLVVVTGEPLAGKTATAWAALNRNADDNTRIFNAHSGTDLRELPAALRGRDPAGTYVVWLDDLESHLDERGLVAGPLAQLAHEGVLVLATMRDAAYEAHRFGDHPTARALRGARTVDLTCDWSEDELARLAPSDDPRLRDAVRWRGELGVTQFLSVGPELWEEWRRASRPGGRANGHLLVSAAIDAARCGLTSGLAPGTWEYMINVRGVYGYSRVHGGRLLDGPVSQDDLEWATRPRLGVSGLLVPGAEEGTWRACGTLVADASRCPGLPPFTSHLWGTMAHVAAEYDLPEREEVSRAARDVVRIAAEAGELGADAILAVLSTWAGDAPEARRWWGRLAEREPSMADSLGRYLLLEQGELTEAIPYIQTAAEAGNPEPAELLGFLLLARALHWLGVAAENGKPSAGEVLPALRAALGEEQLVAALMRHRAEAAPKRPPAPGPALSSERAVRIGVDLILGRHHDPALEETLETPPDTVKE